MRKFGTIYDESGGVADGPDRGDTLGTYGVINLYNLNDATNLFTSLLEAVDGSGHISCEAISILNFYDETDSVLVSNLDSYYVTDGDPTSYALAALMYTVDADLYLAEMYIPFDISTGFSDSIPFEIYYN